MLTSQSPPITPHTRAVGSGPTVLCLHSSTSSSRQWLGLMETLERDHRVVAVDLFGYGKTLPWPNHRPLSLDDEVDLVAPVIAAAHGPLHLVGHSYGGAVAARAALRFPQRIASLTLYESVLFNLLIENASSSAASAEIIEVEREVRTRVETADYIGAAQQFIDYWSGSGAWYGLPDWRREKLAERIAKAVCDFDATFGDKTPLRAYGQFRRPTLLLYGLRSPSASRRIVELLGTAWPHAEIRGLLELGHLGPVTHPGRIDHAIAGFLRGLSNVVIRPTIINMPATRDAIA